MPSRLQSLISRCALVVLTSLATYACDNTEDDQPSGPPPVLPGLGKKPSGGAGNTTPPGMITSGTSSTVATGMMTAAVMNDADSGSSMMRDGGIDETDAGARPDAGGSLAGRGAAGMLAAGSGGRSGTGGAGGTGGNGAQAGAPGGATSPECQNQFCFSLIDCWLSDATNCNYTNCLNFTCQ